MLSIIDTFLTSKPRKIILIDFIFISNLFLARPKSATVRSRLNSDSSTSSRSKPSGGIPTRTTATTSSGN
jgi:hypothetical protein